MDTKVQENSFVGVVGFGRMGGAFARRLKQAGKQVVVYDPSSEAQEEAHEAQMIVAASLHELGEQAEAIFLLVPAGKIVDDTLNDLSKAVSKDTIIIDAGNSNFHDSIRRHSLLADIGIAFLDCGTSGGVHGFKDGFCLMIGGEEIIYKKIIDLFKVLAAPDGYALVGPPGAGHYVKMIHNGIEYALLQAYAEGFHLLAGGRYKSLDLAQIAHLWGHGSVIRSFILQLIAEIFDEIKDFAQISGKVSHTGMGQWTVDEGREQNISLKLIEDALEIRKKSHETGGDFATKLVAVLRNKFGGHTAKGCEVCKE